MPRISFPSPVPDLGLFNQALMGGLCQAPKSLRRPVTHRGRIGTDCRRPGGLPAEREREWRIVFRAGVITKVTPQEWGVCGRGQTGDRQRISGKLRRKFMSVPSLRRPVTHRGRIGTDCRRPGGLPAERKREWRIVFRAGVITKVTPQEWGVCGRGQTGDRQRISGKLRRKFMSVPSLRRPVTHRGRIGTDCRRPGGLPAERKREWRIVFRGAL